MVSWKIYDVVFEADEINQGLAVSPWSGHRQFAYDLLAFVKPQRVVELGTHYGCSFFSFLQACKNLDLSAEIVAIDSWEGDEQAGFYGDEVLDVVKKTIAEKFPTQNYRLIRKYFCDALADIEDESIDILHIDGLHTYEAVSEDYNTWLCKLKPDGIVLFHDVDSKLGYGTNVFWKEIQEKFPHNYMFPHSWGLGVLFPKGEKYYELFEQNNMRDKMLIYEYRAQYQLVNRQLQDHIVMVRERDEAIKSNEAMIKERDEVIARSEEMIKGRDEAIRSNEAMIKERDEVIARSEAMIEERDEVIRSNEAMIKERDEVIRSNEAMIKERDGIICANEAMIEERDGIIRSDEAMIKERDEVIRSNEAMIKERDEVIHSNEEMIKARDEAIRSNEEMIRSRDEAIKSNEQMIQDRDALIRNMEEKLRDTQKEV